jgi:hypothetical protein
MAPMLGLDGISKLDTAQSAMENSVQRLKVKVTSSHGDRAIPTISAETYRLWIQVPGS